MLGAMPGSPSRSRAVRGLTASLVAVAWTAAHAASAQPSCPWGRDPQTLVCLPRPVGPPPPPPAVLLDAEPAAEVYRVLPVPAESPGADGPCPPQKATRLGPTPIQVDNEVGTRSYCFTTPEYAPHRITVTIGPSGVTRAPIVHLVHLARLSFVWSEECPYRAPPAEGVILQLDDAPPLGIQSLSKSLSIAQGDHSVVVRASGYETTQTTVRMGPPGSPDVRHPLCMAPDDKRSLTVSPESHPLAGLYLRAIDPKTGNVTWQGPAPTGGVLSLPAKHQDSPSFSLYLDPKYVRQIDSQSATFSPSNFGKQIEINLRLPGHGVNAEDLDVEGLSRECHAVTKPDDTANAEHRDHSSQGAFCNDTAYGMVYKNHRSYGDPAVQTLLKDGCEKGSVTACTALDVAGNRQLVTERLSKACADSDDLAACLRLQQPDISGNYFLRWEGASVPSEVLGVDTKKDFVPVLGFRGAAATASPTPVLASVDLAFRFALKHTPFWVGLHLVSLELAAIPQRGASGSQSYAFLGGAGFGLDFTVQLSSSPLYFDACSFVAGYVNGSASTAGAYGALRWQAWQKVSLAARGGIARLPGGTGSGTDAIPGGVVQPIVGLGLEYNLPD
jgi:hypothetical protein